MPRIYYEYVPIWPSYETCLEMMNAKIQEFRVAVISGKEERRLDLLKRNQGNSAGPFSLCFIVSMPLAPYALMCIFWEQRFLPAANLL